MSDYESSERSRPTFDDLIDAVEQAIGSPVFEVSGIIIGYEDTRTYNFTRLHEDVAGKLAEIFKNSTDL